MAPPRKNKTAARKAAARKSPGVKASATKAGPKKRASYTFTTCGIGMTLYGGTVPTPRDDLTLHRSEMLLVPQTAEGTVFETCGSLVLKSGVTVDGNHCEVDGDDCEVNGSFCIVNGDRARVNGAQCVVRGRDAVVAGDHCIVAKEAVAKEVSGKHCTIRGIVLKQTGAGFKLEGGSIAVQATGGTTLWSGGVSMAFNNHSGSQVGVQCAGTIVNRF